MIVALLLLGGTIVFNSCSQGSEFVESSTSSEFYAYSKTVSITDASGLNSIDLIVSADDQSLLNLFNSKTFILEIFKSREEALSNQKSDDTPLNDENIATGSEDDPSFRIKISFENENFQPDVMVNKISLAKLSNDSRADWYEIEWNRTEDYCDITRVSWLHRVYYKYSFCIDGVWTEGISKYTLIKNGTTVTIRAKDSDKLRVWTKARDVSKPTHYIYFYN